MTPSKIEYYAALLQNLNVDVASLKKNGFAAPHQPILVISIIQAFERGLVSDEKIYLTPELVDLFTTNWSKLVTRGNYHPTIALPFFHLKSKLKGKTINWWRLIANPGCELLIENTSSMRSFRNLSSAVDHAEIDIELAVVLSIRENRTVLIQAVLQKYFPDKSNIDLSDSGNHFDEISSKIVNESPAEYIANILRLKERFSGDEKQRELFQQEIFIRGGAFKRDIPKYYGYNCCISRLKVDATFTISMIDACHIVPFSKSYDDTISNGLALCPNLHRAFDRGLISIDDNYRVIVSQKFAESQETSYSIKKLAGTAILLPSEPGFLPSKVNLAWHRTHIFHS
jgi:putative restriction endonuclease